jgi:hypothetical protein
MHASQLEMANKCDRLIQRLSTHGSTQRGTQKICPFWVEFLF